MKNKYTVIPIHTFVTAITISAEDEDVFNAAMQAVNDRLVELHLNLDIHCCDDATKIPDDATVSWTSSYLFDHSDVQELEKGSRSYQVLNSVEDSKQKPKRGGAQC